jgi:hypothetical protein
VIWGKNVKRYLDNLKTRWRMIFCERTRKVYREVIPGVFKWTLWRENRYRPIAWFELLVVLVAAMGLACFLVLMLVFLPGMAAVEVENA